jgi:hypothetical protein
MLLQGIEVQQAKLQQAKLLEEPLLEEPLLEEPLWLFQQAKLLSGPHGMLGIDYCEQSSASIIANNRQHRLLRTIVSLLLLHVSRSKSTQDSFLL